MALNNLKPIMKEKVLTEKEEGQKPALLKRKPGMKPSAKPSGLVARLTGGK